MVNFVVSRVTGIYNRSGLQAAQAEYRLYFVRTNIYVSQKAGVDAKLKELGREDIIVNK